LYKDEQAACVKSQEATTTPDLNINASLITVGFVTTGSDVPSLPVMSLKMKK